MAEVVERGERFVAEQCGEALQRTLATLLSRQLVELAGVDEPQQNPGPVGLRADVEGDEHRSLVGQRFTGEPLVAPERSGIRDVGLAEPALWPLRGQLPVFGGQRRAEFDRAPMLRRNCHDHELSVH